SGDHDLAFAAAEAAVEPEQISRQYNAALYISLPLPLAFAADGAHDDALDLFRRTVAEAPAALTKGTLSAAVTVLAAITALRGDRQRAAILLGSARAAFERGFVRSPMDVALYTHYLLQPQHQIGDRFATLH